MGYTDSTNTNSKPFYQGLTEYWEKNGRPAQSFVYFSFPAANVGNANQGTSSWYNQKVAKALAAYVQNLQATMKPNEPVYIIAFSNGTIITHLALEKGMKVERVIYMGSALDRDVNIAKALKNSKGGIISYTSKNDTPAYRVGGAGQEVGFKVKPNGLIELPVNEMRHGSGTDGNGIAQTHIKTPPQEGRHSPICIVLHGVQARRWRRCVTTTTIYFHICFATRAVTRRSRSISASIHGSRLRD